MCLGTKRFQFDRLLKKIDLLIEENVIRDEVFAQIGSSNYIPVHYSFERYISPQEYDDIVNESDLIITHGGTGAIVKALKANKQVIAVPRREKYGEHSDDHQLQIVDFFTEQGYIYRVDDMNELSSVIREINKNPISKKFEGTGRIISIIDKFIEGN